jgi:hypothetical protein
MFRLALPTINRKANDYTLKNCGVKVGKLFDLTFKVDLVNNFILFVDFDHHDTVY